MRRVDKKLNMMKANILAESIYLESKGLIKEGNFSGPQKTDPDIDVLAREIIKTTKGDMTKENDAIVSTANGDGDIQRRLTSRVQQLKNSEAINEIGPETAAKAITFINDPRKVRLLIDATNSLFSKYINNDNLEFYFQSTSHSAKPNKYVLTEVIPDYVGRSVNFKFNNENGVDTNAPFADNKKSVNITYDIKNDSFKNTGTNENKFTQINELVNPFTANFFVQSAKWIRKAYFTANPVTKMDDVNKSIIPDPDFDINTKVKKQDFKNF